MYTGRVTISQQNVIDLIRAADLLELTSVKNETLKVIEEHISFDVSIQSLENYAKYSLTIEVYSSFFNALNQIFKFILDVPGHTTSRHGLQLSQVIRGCGQIY